MAKIELSPIKNWDTMEMAWREILSGWWDDTVLVGEPSNEHIKKHYSENIYFVWLLGKKLTTGDSPPGSLKWKRSVLFLSRNVHLKIAVDDRFEEVVSRPEESTRSLYLMSYAIVDDDYLADPEYSWVHTVECPIICVVDDTFKEGAVGDCYLVTNPMSLYTLPPNHGPKVYPLTFPYFHCWDFNFLPHWREREELVVFVDPTALPVDFHHRIIENCKMLGIPCTDDEKVDLGNYRYVIYPVGMDVHPLYVPTKMTEAVKRGCVVLTNNGCALHYPNAHGGLDVTDEGEFLLGLLWSYEEIKTDFDNPAARVSTMLSLVRNYTYEGILFHLVPPEKGVI